MPCFLLEESERYNNCMKIDNKILHLRHGARSILVRKVTQYFPLGLRHVVDKKDQHSQGDFLRPLQTSS